MAIKRKNFAVKYCFIRISLLSNGDMCNLRLNLWFSASESFPK